MILAYFSDASTSGRCLETIICTLYTVYTVCRPMGAFIADSGADSGVN